MSRSRVAVVRCDAYDQRLVDAAVGRGLALLGGAEAFVQSGERIVLKPNLLVASAPEKAVTTHPAVFSAVARALTEAGAELSWGDSPGVGSGLGVGKRAGIAEVAATLGIPVADFEHGRVMPFPEGNLIKRFTVAEGVAAADGLVSLPKLKTHALTRMTGAVKNQFGCVPGFLKGEFHAKMHNVELFSQMLVDLNLLLRPRLYVMDAVVGMEGNGPRNGDPRQVGVLLLSDDPVAIDAVGCRIMALDPALVETLVYGERWRLGSASDIETVGDELPVLDDYRVNRTPVSTTRGLGSALGKRLLAPRPYIIEERCTRCGTCVKVCPVDPKAVDWRGDDHTTPPAHDYDRCIRCYCCQEMCPERAIEVKTPMMGRLIRR
ncbi:MAG: DUF362 domain-containing protein [Coriobacteriia bacterium]|nr:DUF362 domain-containing protein [Coriobacteriia bacterium]MBN2839817.1 DUF362 domain-containing protein [Coriobacteriia bacterium]